MIPVPEIHDAVFPNYTVLSAQLRIRPTTAGGKTERKPIKQN